MATPLPLGRSLRSQLVLRLGLGGVIIATVLGSAVYWREIERIEDGFVGKAVLQAASLAARLPAHLDATSRPAILTAMAAFLDDRRARGTDHFVGVEIYAPDQASLAESYGTDMSTDTVASAIDRSHHVFPKPGKSEYTVHRLDGEVYLQVMTELSDGVGGSAKGYFEGIYHVPADMVASARHDGLRVTLMVILSVLATSVLLYPLIRRLHGGLIDGARALMAANLGAIEMLGNAIAKRDSDTNSHNYRVTLYAFFLAEKLHLPHAVMATLIKGAFLHDVGKLAIPDSILLKPGKLDDAEFAVMKTHVEHGLDIVNRFDWLRDAAEVVGCHHEKFDGSGYLAGLAGEDIPITARIFTIADVFDALTSRRPYKEPFPLDQALGILEKGRGSHFDPHLLDLFLPMAPILLAHYGGREDLDKDDTLRNMAQAYFQNSLDD